MNYDHSFHAGGFSDVLKHAVLAACIAALNAKEKPYRIIDAFAGQGLYDFQSDAAIRCPEWQDGIAKLDIHENIPFFAPYFSVLQQLNPSCKQGKPMRYYAGSPVLAQNLVRVADRITLLEANPKVTPILRENIGRDKAVSILESDAWRALAGLLPPPEKRGLVLIDPPFETPNELERLFPLLQLCLKKWRDGVFMVWLPLKTKSQEEFVVQSLKNLSAELGFKVESLFLKLQVREYGENAVVKLPGAIANREALKNNGLPANAVFLINPPYAVLQTAPAAAEYMAQVLSEMPVGKSVRVEC